MNKNIYKILNITFYVVAALSALLIVLGAITFMCGFITLPSLIILELLSTLAIVAAFEVDNILKLIEKNILSV